MGASCAQGKLGKGISLILRHGWRPKSMQNHVRNAEVVPILYSFEPLGNAKTVLHGIHCLSEKHSMSTKNSESGLIPQSSGSFDSGFWKNRFDSFRISEDNAALQSP